MVQVQPFRAWRPVRDKVHLVGSRSYVSYGQKDLAEKLRGNPTPFCTSSIRTLGAACT